MNSVYQLQVKLWGHENSNDTTYHDRERNWFDTETVHNEMW